MKTNKITTLVFCLLIAVISVASMINPVRRRSETENRELQQPPVFSTERLFSGSFTADYEKFITDQFVARDAWIALHTKAELALGKRDVSGVYFARDGYYIEKLTPDAERIEDNLSCLAALAENIGGKCRLRIMLAPTASLILSDKLPANAPVWDQQALLDRAAELPGAIDLRPALLEHSDEYLYYRTDHHWTTEGAYYAYAELARSLDIEPLSRDKLTETVLTEEFLGTTIAKVGIAADHDTIVTLESTEQPTVSVVYNEGQRTADSLYSESKLETRDKYGVFLGGNDPIVDMTTSVKNRRTLLMIKDSYAHCMTPLLVNHYERIILIDLRYLSIGVSAYIDRLAAEGVRVDDAVVLYNASGFAEERSLIWMKK